MECLITGGAGFVASHLAETLLRRGDNVVLYDNLNSEYDPALKHRNLQEIRVAGPATFVEGDIRDQAALRTAIETYRPEVVFHLAALPGVRRSVEVPLVYLDNNVQGTAALLESVRDSSVRKLVFASSSSVYGNGVPSPFDEDRTATQPISPYAASKLAGEKLCHAYAHLYGLQTVCLRLFTIYGPRQRPDLAFHKFIRAMEAGDEISMFGDGSTQRDYTYCDDAVAGLLAAAELDTPFETINIGGGRTYSLKVVFEILEEVTGKRARLNTMGRQPGDVDATSACIAKAARLLKYRPSTPLREGLRRQVEWARQRGGSN